MTEKAHSVGDVFLQTPRLKLREFVPADQAAVQVYAGDPMVTRWTSWGPNTPEMTASVLQFWGAERRREPRAEWPIAIIDRKDSTLIGGTGLTVNWELGDAEFGYVLRRSAWNCGFATEAGAAVIEWGLDHLCLNRIVAHCSLENAASMRVLEKLGFQRQGGAKEFQKKNGEKLSFRVFSLDQAK
ncbi:MAG TPA: GNAT family N-acetyltransferase [Candidatus Koribacter sp.]|jgi:RimJ/RimL family protein N-acetyltransferase